MPSQFLKGCFLAIQKRRLTSMTININAIISSMEKKLTYSTGKTNLPFHSPSITLKGRELYGILVYTNQKHTHCIRLLILGKQRDFQPTRIRFFLCISKLIKKCWLNETTIRMPKPPQSFVSPAHARTFI